MGKMITKADIILAVVLLILGLGSPFLLRTETTEEKLVVITMSGEEIGSYPLSENRTVAVTEDGLREIGKNYARPLGPNDEILNLVVIENGSVRVAEASCKGRDCVNMGPISKEGQVIACLPHRLLIGIAGAGETPDAVIK